MTIHEKASSWAPPENSSAAPVVEQAPLRVVSPARRWAPLGLRELWEYRELLYFLTWRNIKLRYKQTVLGGAWAMLWRGPVRRNSCCTT